MSRFHSYLQSAKTILRLYNGDLPFSVFLKMYFSGGKKFGSRDRKTIASLCYYYFRTGFAVRDQSDEEIMLVGIFLGNHASSDLLQNVAPELNGKVALPLAEKLALEGIAPETIFPFNNHLSDDINVAAFNTSFLVQPKVFVRIRPGKTAAVLQKLTAAKMDFEVVNNSCLSFANGAKLETVLEINSEVVIQDLNSQRAGKMLSEMKAIEQATVWDCCAASGGKSILAYDLLPGSKLTVSDVRQSIIHNLQQRFKAAEIKNYQSFVADIANQTMLQNAIQNKTFDIIICDAPCSGSGTWSRTPEQLRYFKAGEITRYSNLQKNIAANTIPHLSKGGYFLYITCSVFKQENEEVVDFIQGQSNLTLVAVQLLKGYELQADTMFAALFHKEI